MPSQNKPIVILQQQQQQESHWILKYIVLLPQRDKKILLNHITEKHYTGGRVLQLQECFSSPGQDF